MAIPILNHMDFQKSAEIRNVRLHNQAASGVTGAGTGQILYDSGTVKYYNGSAWVSLSTTSGSMSSFTLSDGSNTQTINDGNTLTISATSGTGISATVGATDTVTIAGTNATTSAKGVASFSSDNFAVSSGAVTIKDGGVANAELVNSSITINGSAISLGGSVTTPNTQLSGAQVKDFAGAMFTGNTETGITATYQTSDDTVDLVVADSDFALTGDVTGSATQTAKGNVSIATTIGSGTVHHGMLSDDIISGQGALTSGLASTDELMISDAGVVKRMDVSVLQSYLQSNLSFTSNTDVDVSNANLLTRLANLESAGGATDQNIVIGTDSGDTIVITGNLQVSGTTTTVNSTTVDLNDHNITLDSGNSTSAVVNGAGITLSGGSGDDATFTYNASTNAWEFKLGSAYEDIKAAAITGTTGNFVDLDISGDVDVDGTLEADAITLNGTALGALATLDAVDSAQIVDGSVDNVHLSGSIANSKLANSSITINGQAISLGGSVNTPNTQLSLASANEVKNGTNATKAITPDTLAAKSVHATIDVSDSNFTSNLYAEITHSLSTEDVIVQLFDSSTKETVYADIARTDKANSASTSKIKITFASAPANDVEVLITSIKGSTAGSVAYS